MPDCAHGDYGFRLEPGDLLDGRKVIEVDHVRDYKTRLLYKAE